MPIIHVTVTKKLPADVKAELMEYFAEQICANTSTLSKNIYVYIHEMDKENVRKLAPTVLIDWTMMPDRTDDAKKPIMAADRQARKGLRRGIPAGDRYHLQRHSACRRYAWRRNTVGKSFEVN